MPSDLTTSSPPESTGSEANADPLFDAKGAAAYLGLVGTVKHPEQAVRTMCRNRRIRSTKVAGKIMVRRSWLETYIAEHVRDGTY